MNILFCQLIYPISALLLILFMIQKMRMKKYETCLYDCFQLCLSTYPPYFLTGSPFRTISWICFTKAAGVVPMYSLNTLVK